MTDLLFEVISWLALGFGLGSAWYGRRTLRFATLSLESANAAMAIAITERQEAIRHREDAMAMLAAADERPAGLASTERGE